MEALVSVGTPVRKVLTSAFRVAGAGVAPIMDLFLVRGSAAIFCDEDLMAYGDKNGLLPPPGLGDVVPPCLISILACSALILLLSSSTLLMVSMSRAW